jgi:site-specific recombinase XerD
MSDADNCRDAIERFLDRSWMMDRTPLPAVAGHRVALNALNVWMQRHRETTLTGATALDIRAMLDSRHWDSVSRQFEALLGLVTRFYRGLLDSKSRADDPIETLIGLELTAAARKREAVRLAPSRKPRRKFHFSGSPVV